MARAATVLAAATVALFLVAIAGAVGELTQKASPAGCISEDGTGGACQDGKALTLVADVAVSSDGRNVYSAAEGLAIGIFDRDAATGALTQKPGLFGCISEDGTGGACQDGTALFRPIGVVSTADGKSVYTASWADNAVAIFDRDTAGGTLVQKSGTAACVSETGGTCQDGKALLSPFAVAASPDSKSVYVASRGSGAIATFDRDAATGALTQKPGTAGCVSDNGTTGTCQDGIGLDGATSVTVSTDNKSVYVVSIAANAIVIFDRDTTTGALTQKPGIAGCVSETGAGPCQDGTALNAPTDVVTSADGKSVYVASVVSSAVAILDRDPATGALTQKPGIAGCVSETGAGPCQDGTALDGAQGVAVSPDNTSAYVSVNTSDAVAIFDRDPASGALTQKPGIAGCVSETGAGPCQDGTALLNPVFGVAASPDGRNVYVAAGGSAALTIFDRATPPPPPPPAPPPAPPPGPPPRDRVAPTVSGFAVSPARVPRTRGSRFRFRLSERATTRILLERALAGRRVGRRCVAPTRRNRGRARCTRFLRAGTLTFRNRPAGANNIVFRARTLRLGTHRATLTATDAAGNRSRARRAGFRVVRR